MATLPDKPVTGEATKIEWAEGIIDYLADLNSRLGGSGGGGGNVVANPSFELDANDDGDPDSWTVTESSVTFALDSANGFHGRQAAKFTFNAAAGTGTLTTDAYYECAEGQRLELSYSVKGSYETSAGDGLPHKAQILWYDETSPVPALLTTETLINEGDSPNYWDHYSLQTVAPVGAFYFRVRLQAGDGSTAVSTETMMFDGVSCGLYRGSVLVDVTSPIVVYNPVTPPGGGTVTITATEDELGSAVLSERPTKVFLGVSVEMTAGDSTNITTTDGYGNKMEVLACDNAGGTLATEYLSAERFWVALNERGEFTLVTSNNAPSVLVVTVYGYEV